MKQRQGGRKKMGGRRVKKKMKMKKKYQAETQSNKDRMGWDGMGEAGESCNSQGKGV